MIYNLVAPLVGLAIFVGIWFLAASVIGISLILPTPIQTLSGFFSLLKQAAFYVAIGKTLARTLIGFAIAFALACIFAFLSKISDFFRKAFAPLTVILRVLPTISVILLVLIWVYSRFAPVVITFIVIFPMLYTTVLNAADEVDPDLLEMGRAYGFSHKKKILNIYLPSMTPSILTGVSLTLSFSVKLTVAAEVLSASQQSMGRYMKQVSAYLETDLLLAWTLAAILLGFLLEGMVLFVKKLIERRYYGK